MRGHAPRKRFGQNFLVSPGVVRRIVDAIHPLPGDPVVEIGPGLGALTEPLLEVLPVLHVVEIDRDLIARLRLAHSPDRLVIHEGDALDFDFGALGDGLRIVGNLPYNISTPLLFHLATFADRVRDMHFMLQKEVVDRMVAAPGSSEYGRLSVMLQYRFVMERLFVVPPGAFDPAPKVDSAIVRLAPKERSRLDAADPAMLALIVTAAFGQRRKMLRNNLRDFATADELEQAGIAPTARAEDQPLENFVRLANGLAKKKTAG